MATEKNDKLLSSAPVVGHVTQPFDYSNGISRRAAPVSKNMRRIMKENTSALECLTKKSLG